MTINGKITSELGAVPTDDNIADIDGLKENPPKMLASSRYVRFFSSAANNINTLKNKGFTNEFRNPDFNFLSANGTNPVTEATATPFEVVSNWFINGNVGNTYTITPTAHSSVPFLSTGSNYYLNVNIGALTQPFYFSNVNYSTTGQFNSIDKYSNKIVTLSSVVNNISGTLAPINLSASTPSGGVSESQPFYLQPSVNLINVTYQVPDFTGDPINPGDNLEFRVNFLDGSDGLNADFYYLKLEVSRESTPLNINHILEQLLINNLV